MRTNYRDEYDKLIASGNYPEFLTGIWSKDKESFIKIQRENELLELMNEEEEDENYDYYDEY